MTSTILEIIQRNADNQLHAAEEIARMIQLRPINESELNATLLVNFLRLPEEHQRHLAESMMAKRPDVFPNYWQQRCKLAEKYLAAVPIDHRQWSLTSAEHHKQMYHEFIRNNQKPE